MLILLSPAKSLDLETPTPCGLPTTQPRLLAEAERLIDVLAPLPPAELEQLMGISSELAALNADRFSSFTTPFTTANSRPALATFAGDVYRGMAALATFGQRDFTEAQKTVRVLSGLYGVLRPLDLMQPYRLEMGTRLATERGRDLYDWWGATITDLLRADLADSPGPDVIVNLASEEYFSAVDPTGLRVISPRFEDQTPSGQWRVIAFHAKRARGSMAGWLVRQRSRTLASITGFDADGYQYQEDLSTPSVPVFRRPR